MINVLFIVDTSGSMYNNKISSVNSALVESVGVIRKKVNDGLDIDVFYSCFDETMTCFSKADDFMQSYLPDFEIKDTNGFYKYTKFTGLYDGLLDYFENSINQTDSHLIFLLTDGKAVDSMNYIDKLNKIRNIDKYRDAIRFVVRVDGDIETSSKDLFEFVDNDANRIVDLSGLANVIDVYLSDEIGSYNFDEVGNVFE